MLTAALEALRHPKAILQRHGLSHVRESTRVGSQDDKAESDPNSRKGGEKCGTPNTTDQDQRPRTGVSAPHEQQQVPFDALRLLRVGSPLAVALAPAAVGMTRILAGLQGPFDCFMGKLLGTATVSHCLHTLYL